MSRSAPVPARTKKPDRDAEAYGLRHAEREVQGPGFYGLADPSSLHDPRLPVAQRQELARRLGSLHGNRKLLRYLDPSAKGRPRPAPTPHIQRGLMDIVGGALTPGIDAIFRGVVLTNRAVASTITIPDDWPGIVREYAAANPDDAAVLTTALGRSPTYRRGGWIMDVQQGAAAMTLDTDVFVTGNLRLDTYVHELVHVTQYANLGATGFLVSYFGLSAATIARRLMNREPLDVMRSSPHEEAAYQLEQRFRTWYQGAKGHHPGTKTA
jgi:hypothetical protein